MKPKPTKKFNGVSYDHHAEFENRPDAVEAKQSLIDQGHKARFSKGSGGFYHVYALHEEKETKESKETKKSYSAAAVQPDLTEAPDDFPIETICNLDCYKHSLYLHWKNPTLLNTLYDFKDDINSENSDNDPVPKSHVI